jgi:osmoprotectant transport system permease protein
VVGLGTLATPVGARSLGDFIFSGLQTRDTTSVLVGCLGAAGLALAFDAALALAERAARVRRPLIALPGFAILAALGLFAFRPTDRRAVVVGGKPFTEQYVLTRLIERRINAVGLPVDRRDSLGSTVLLDALLAGEVDVAVDYSGTLWSSWLKRDGTSDAATVRAAVCGALAERGARCIGRLGFENAYALAVRSADARARGWRSIADLAPSAGSLTMGADYEFLRRPEWAAVRAAYGLAFGAEKTFDPTFLYEAAAGGQADVVTAYTTDGRVAAFDLALLDDPRHALPPYDALVLVSADCPEPAARALEALVEAIDVADMREANRRVDLEGRPPEEAAAWLDAQLPHGR